MKNKNITLLSVLFATLVLSLMPAVSAFHTSTVSLEPEWSASDQDIDYSVDVCNTGGQPIDEVRIYDNELYTNFNCVDNVGWTELLIPTNPPSCLYISDSSDSNIEPGECEIFEFSA
ncbi:MAG: hypothetical protein ABIH34_03945, partial [Nanoarchaeota archaeon]